LPGAPGAGGERTGEGSALESEKGGRRAFSPVIPLVFRTLGVGPLLSPGWSRSAGSRKRATRERGLQLKRFFFFVLLLLWSEAAMIAFL